MKSSYGREARNDQSNRRNVPWRTSNIPGIVGKRGRFEESLK